MQVETWKVEDVTPYENNPRKNDEAVNYVANSIREFGFQQPLVVDSNGVLVVGHTRLKAAKKLGLEEVPVVVADGLSQNQIDAYRLADNKTNELSEWDFDKLNVELEGIDWLDVDMTGFGFYLDQEDGNDGLEDRYSQNVGTVTYEPKETNHKPSDLYTMDYSRFSDVIDKVGDGDIKEMLLVRANWFACFDFAKIADYYAYQATAEEKRAFEALGLVLLDRDQLIENGFADAIDFMRED